MEKFDMQRAFKDANVKLVNSKKSLSDDYDQSYQMPQKRLQKSLTDETNNENVSKLEALRLNFRKSHTCGSLFAKCNCSSTSLLSPSFSTSASSSSLTKSEGFTSNNNNFNSSTIIINDDVDEYDVYSSSNSNNDDYIFLANQNCSKSYKQFSDRNFRRNSSVNSSISSTFTKQLSDINNTTQSKTTNNNTSNATHTGGGRRIIASTDKKSKKLFQSYSHPDTTFIFTDENKNPSGKPITIRTTSPTVTTKGGKVEIKHPKRLSSPNIGNYAILDVSVHPEVLLKISRKNVSSNEEESTESHANEKISSSSTLSVKSLNTSVTSTETIIKPKLKSKSTTTRQHRPILKRSERKEYNSFSTDSENSIEIIHDSVIDSMIQSASGSENLIINSSPSSTTSSLQEYKLESGNSLCENNKSENVENNGNLENLKSNGHQNNSNSKFNQSLDPAQKFFQESGILGPVVCNTSSNLIRRTSKIMQDPNVIDKIRKNSKLLRNSPEGRKGYNSSNISNEDTDLNKTTMTINMKMENNDNFNDDYREDKIKSLEDEIYSLRDLIKNRDSEISKLKREIHKLKSVLQQTTNVGLQVQYTGQQQLLRIPTISPELTDNCELMINSSSIINNNTDNNNAQGHNHDTCNSSCGSFLSDNGSKQTATNTVIEKTLTSRTSLTQNAAIIDGISSNSILCGNTNTFVSGSITATEGVIGCSKSNQLHITVPVLKKQGVSGESSDAANHSHSNIPIPKYEKDFRSKQLIKDAIMDNDFLKNIDSSQVRELVESMYSLQITKGEYVIREGEVGSHLYVSAEGDFEVIKNGQILGLMGPGKAFGELAILYNCTRTASVRVLCNAKVWVLDRRVFQQIMMRTGIQRIEENVSFLKSVPLLKNLSNDVLTKIADVLEVEFYPAGTYIIRQGASGDTFFLISQGSVKVTQKLPNSNEEKEIRILKRGDYFGEQALINEDKRTANIIALDPGVECLTLDRESFTHLIGDLCELKEKSYGDEGRILATKIEEEAKEIFGKNIKQELQDLKLDDLEVVSTLGIGGFGRVELVKCYRDNQVQTFALKCLKKKHIIDTRQEEHVFSERTIMLSCNTPFICRLYRTFRDTKYVYMLLEACMGGEVWTMLRDRGCFDENTTQFIIGCVLQAFEYLHSRGIIYRDLKPENLMLDERGYVKLVDFGFAKYIGHSNKTWTFCGTPEYVAPEIILNKGHDRAVDYWALGILIHELLNGTPPFSASDPMKTYNIILKGIDMIEFPKHMSRPAITLIKKLCRDVPAERLGYQKGGIQDIKKHKWFQGFDWDGLSNLALIPPFLRPISNALDTSYFDKFPVDTEIPPDEFSGWDSEF